LSDTSQEDWRDLYARSQREKNPERLPEICARARRATQARQIPLATFSRIHGDEIGELEAALRHLWEIEEKNRKR
jgi:hypothetical protein